MSVRLDHLVILVEDLERAVHDYERLGFTVTPGGTHADGLTSNALVPFADGTYLELVRFIDPEDTRDNVWGWRAFAGSGGGLIDFCALSEDLTGTVRALRETGLEVDGPDEGGRTLPDGREIRWLVARVRQRGRFLPFLIQDLTDRAMRVPSGPGSRHPNGATGIASLRVAVPDVQNAAVPYEALTGRRVPGGTVPMGDCSVELVGLRADEVWPGPRGARLAGVESKDLQPGLLHGARVL
jgi:catechol 2,3-dioxygenase-like lactoylglutathione lyase family enzyme